jgi:hypothetical protein
MLPLVQNPLLPLILPNNESENILAIYVSGKWHQILRLNAQTLSACTIAITLLSISTGYTQI